MAGKSKELEHEVVVKFGTQSCNGKKTAQIGMTIQRGDLKWTVASSLFCGAQLEAKMCYDPNSDEDVKGQKKFREDKEFTLTGTPTCQSFHTYPDRFSATLVFPLSAVDVRLLACFANQPGRLWCTRVGDSETSSDEADDKEE